MTIARVQNWPFPLDIDNFEAVSEYLILLYRALQEDSTLRIEDFQSALHGRVLGEYNTLLGIDAGYSITTGTYNTLLGQSAGYSITTGDRNIAVGYNTLYTTTDAYDNIAIGHAVLWSDTEGYRNIGIGYLTLYANTDADGNIAIGSQALYNTTEGGYNVAIGWEAGRSNVTGVSNIFIGYQAGYSETGSNKLYIDNSNTATPLIYGDFSTDALTINGTLTVTGNTTLSDGGSLNLQEDINFTGATTENLIKFPDNLADALSIQEGANKYVTFITTDDEEDIVFYKPLDILHASVVADDHALEIDVDAAGYGDVKALDIDYITGDISAGEDEGILLLNINKTLAEGGDIFALEVLATDQVTGTTGVYGLKTGPEIGPIHQDSGTFANPTLATNNTPTTDVSVMRDGLTTPAEKTTAIFEADNEYIIIGANAAFQDLELIFTTVSSKGIKPTFWYSVDGGSNNFTQFTPVDGTNGCRHTGVISWDASDLSGHVADATTGKFDIKIIRTKGGSFTTPVLGYAKTATTTEYIWDENGDVNVRNLTINGQMTNASQPCFLAYNSTTDANETGDGTQVTIDLDTEVFDQGGNFAADTFTAPVTGRYHFCGSIIWNNLGAAHTGQIIKLVTTARTYEFGHSNPAACRHGATNEYGTTFSMIVDLAATNTVTLQGLVSGVGKTVGVLGGASPLTFLSGALVC